MHPEQRRDEAGTRRRSRGRTPRRSSWPSARVKPSSAATASGSSGSDEPASAPAPSGLRAAARASQSTQPLDVALEARARARAAGGRRSTGWACCRWVMPGIGGAAVPLGLADQRGLQLGHPGGDLPGVRRAGRAAGRWRPGRCGCGRPAACRRARRAARAGRARARCARPRRRPSAGTCPSRRPRVEVVERGEHLAELVVVEQAGAVQHPGVRPRGGQVVRREPPVELHADRQPGQRLGRPAGEPPAPQPVGRRVLPSLTLDHPHRRRSSRLAAHASLVRQLLRSSRRPRCVPVDGPACRVPARWSRRAAILLGRPQSSTKPLASDWSNSVARVVGRHLVVVERRLRCAGRSRRPGRRAGSAGCRRCTCALASSMNAVQGPLERREPQAVVDQLAPPLLDGCA